MSKKFKQLLVPEGYRHYWSKYPEGYTILEALLNWVDSVNQLTGNVNDWNVYLDDFVENFDQQLIPTVETMLDEMVDDGTLATIINEHIFEELNDKVDKIATLTAAPNGVDDTQAIQDVINTMASTILIPEGTYMIDATNPENNDINYLTDSGGLYLHSHQTLIMSDKTILKVIPNDQESYNVIRVVGRENVTIEGGTIQGDRYEHEGTIGQWGYGIYISGGKNITVRNVKAIDLFGDGINIQVRNTSPTPSLREIPYNIIIDNVYCDNNRRQGMSIEAGHKISVANSTFKGTHGHAPESGVDIEPHTTGIRAYDIHFSNCHFEGNVGCGVQLYAISGGEYVENVTFDNCVFDGNNISNNEVGQFYSNQKETTLNNCVFKGSMFDVYLRNDGYTLNQCVFEGVVTLISVDDSLITNNRFLYNNDDNEFLQLLRLFYCDHVNISDNTFILKDNNIYNIVSNSKNIDITNNRLINFGRGFRVYTDSNDVHITNNSFIDVWGMSLDIQSKNVIVKNNTFNIKEGVNYTNKLIYLTGVNLNAIIESNFIDISNALSFYGTTVFDLSTTGSIDSVVKDNVFKVGSFLDVQRSIGSANGLDVIEYKNNVGKSAIVRLDSNKPVLNASNEYIIWDSAEYDDLNFWVASHIITIPKNVNKVKISASLQWENNSNGYRRIDLFRNGTKIMDSVTTASTISTTSYIASPIFKVQEGDTFGFRATQNSGATVDILSGEGTWFSVEVVE